MKNDFDPFLHTLAYGSFNTLFHHFSTLTHTFTNNTNTTTHMSDSAFDFLHLYIHKHEVRFRCCPPLSQALDHDSAVALKVIGFKIEEVID